MSNNLNKNKLIIDVNFKYSNKNIDYPTIPPPPPSPASPVNLMSSVITKESKNILEKQIIRGEGSCKS